MTVRAEFRWRRVDSLLNDSEQDLYLRHHDYPDAHCHLRTWKDEGKWVALCSAIHNGDYNLSLRKGGFRTQRQAKVWAESAVQSALAAVAEWEPLRQQQNKEVAELRAIHSDAQRAFKDAVIKKVKIRKEVRHG